MKTDLIIKQNLIVKLFQNSAQLNKTHILDGKFVVKEVVKLIQMF